MGRRICPDCGARLDPGEICDCRENAKEGGAGGEDEKHPFPAENGCLM